jgi:membrane-bound lytic murein transglycosylase D
MVNKQSTGRWRGRRPRRGLAGLLMAAALAAPALPAEETDENPVGVLFRVGQDLYDQYAPAVEEKLAFLTEANWSLFWQHVEGALQTKALDDLAWMLPEVQTALSSLERMPGGQPYADWLRQRMDYFEMAQHVLKAIPGPEPERPPPPPGSISTPPPRPPPTAPKVPEPIARRREQAAQNEQVWQRKIAGRPAPANAARLVPQLKPIFKAEGVPPEWVWLAEVESSMNPEARSPVGAVGLFQFMPATAERFGVKTKPVDERRVPEKSARAAAQYLKLLHGRFSSWPLALAAYNAGEGRISRTLREHNATTFEQIAAHLPTETQMYVPKVMATVSLREGVSAASLPPPRSI